MTVTFWHGGLRKDKWEYLTNAGFYRPPGIAGAVISLLHQAPGLYAHLVPRRKLKLEGDLANVS